MIMLIVHLLVVPLLVGQLIAYFLKKEQNPFIRYMYGFFGNVAAFNILFTPLMLLKASFTTLLIVYSIVIGAACLYEIVREIRSKDYFWGDYISRIKEQGRLSIFEAIYLVIFVLALGLQIYCSFAGDVGEYAYDDFEYVIYANDNIANDSIMATFVFNGEDMRLRGRISLNSWITYTSYLAKTSGVSVATVCHSVLPVALILVAYCCYIGIAKHLFKERENRLIFLDILSTAIVFGMYSHNAITFRLLGTLWQGKAIFTGIFVPFIILELFKILQDEEAKGKIAQILILSIAGCSFTLLGSGLLVALFGIIWILSCINKKQFVGLRYPVIGCLFPGFQVVLYILIEMILR